MVTNNYKFQKALFTNINMFAVKLVLIEHLIFPSHQLLGITLDELDITFIYSIMWTGVIKFKIK